MANPDPFEGKTVEEILEIIQKDWHAVCGRADYITTRMARAEFINEPPGGAMSDGQLRAVALFVAGLAAVHNGGKGITLAGLLPMLGQLWELLDRAGEGELKKAKFNETFRVEQPKGGM